MLLIFLHLTTLSSFFNVYKLHIYMYVCVCVYLKNRITHYIVVQSLSHVQLFVTPWTAAHQTSLSFTISQSFLKLRSNKLVVLSNHLIFCHPFSSCPHSFPASGSFSVSQLFESCGQSTRASASGSVLPMTV